MGELAPPKKTPLSPAIQAAETERATLPPKNNQGDKTKTWESWLRRKKHHYRPAIQAAETERAGKKLKNAIMVLFHIKLHPTHRTTLVDANVLSVE